MSSPVIPACDLVLLVSSARTLSGSQSGSIVSLTSAGADYKVTLPALTAGFRVKFCMSSSAGTNQIQIVAPSACLLGFKTLAGTSTDESTAKTNVFLGNSTGPVASTAGDVIEMYCDGVNYFWVGRAHIAASIRTT
jgi:hypothetical protein